MPSVSGYDKDSGMICPHCKKDIPAAVIAAHLGAKGGASSKRTITPAQQRKMQAAKKAQRKES